MAIRRSVGVPPSSCEKMTVYDVHPRSLGIHEERNITESLNRAGSRVQNWSGREPLVLRAVRSVDPNIYLPNHHVSGVRRGASGVPLEHQAMFPRWKRPSITA